MRLEYRARRIGFRKGEMQSELHSQRMHIVGHRIQAVGKFVRIGIPVADRECPPQIDDKQLYPKVGGDVCVAAQSLLVDLILISPRVP